MLRGMMLFGVFAGMILTTIILSNITFVFDTGLIVFLILFAFFGVIIMFTSFIYWIAGYYNIFRGRREFGPVHNHYVNLSIIFAALYILSLFGQLFIITISNRIIGGDYYLLRILLGMISSAFLSITWIYLILDIVPIEMKVALWLSLLLSLVISLSTAIIGEISVLAGFFGMALWYVVLFIVIYCYHRTYNRLKNKEILPLLPPTYPFPFPPLLSFLKEKGLTRFHRPIGE